MNKHQKHTKLARAPYGEWARNELAIVGTTCGDIEALANAVIRGLPQYKIAFADADHTHKDSITTNHAINNADAFITYTNKASHTQLSINSQLNAFQKKALLNDCDLVLVNGNHFTAARQIVVIDERKPLEKKLDKLTDIQMILVKDSSAEIPSYLVQQVSNSNQVAHFVFDDAEAIIQHVKKYLAEQIPALNGLVLSGGQSTRMGRDKGDIEYHSKSQREYVSDLLSSYCSEVFISCNREQSKLITNTPKIEDAFLNQGPLGGILSAFQQAPNAAWLTVACDLPFLNEATIEHLIQRRNPSKMATAFRDAEGKFPEPLVTIWEPKAYPVLLQFLAQGYSCPRKALINSDVEILHAPDTFVFKNVNTKKEYNKVLSMLQKEA